MNRSLSLPCLNIALLFFAFVASGLAQETAPGKDPEKALPQPPELSQPKPHRHIPVFGGANEFALETDLQYYEPAPGFDRQNRDIDLAVVRAALAAHFREGWEFQFDVQALRARGTAILSSTPPIPPPVPSNAVALGAGPGARWNFLQFSRCRLFLDAQGDLILNDRPFPTHGSSYDFFLRAGGGLSIRLNDSYWLEPDFRFAHISNGQGFGSGNPTWNGRGLSIGLRRTFRPYSETQRERPASQKDEDGKRQEAKSWTTSVEEYRAVPGTNLHDPGVQHQLRSLRIAHSWPLPGKFEFQFGAVVGEPIHPVQGNEFGGFGPLLRWNFLETRNVHLFADGGADFLLTGSPAFLIPLGGTGYNFFLRGGTGASLRLHHSYWLDTGFHWAHITTGFGPGADNYIPWSGLGVSLALRHTFH
ncbi:MAG: hypothetical protein WAK13_17095 [Terriglobales bacterium]